MSSQICQRVNLSGSVLHRLNSYAVGAAAAGVGILSLSHPAEAKIIYTPTHVSIAEGTPYLIEFGPNRANGGGFVIDWQSGEDQSAVYTAASSVSIFKTTQQGIFARALRSGIAIGPHSPFTKIHFTGMGTRFFGTFGSSTTWAGPWANGGKGIKNRFLGLRFPMNGQIHYGWARLTVTTSSKKFASVVLTGYAYESVPNKPNRAGQEKEQNLVEPASLGHLAQGASAIPRWRVRQGTWSTH